MKELHELRDKLCDELKEYGRKDISSGNLSMIDTLAHALKNLDKIIEVDEDGYSGYYPTHYASYDGMDRRSYARKRDSMGRYSGNGYSRDGLVDKLHELMDEAPDDRTRTEIKRLIDKM